MLSEESNFFLFLAHEYKHYKKNGTGLRSLLDIYVYCIRKGRELDWSYIEKELQKLGIAEFEKHNRALSMHLFSGEPLTEKEKEILDYLMSSGVYGTMENFVHNVIAEKGRAGYLLSRTFPPYRAMKMWYPVLEGRPILLPVFWTHRLTRAIIRKPRIVIYQLKGAFRRRG